MALTHEFPAAAKVESRTQAALRAPLGMTSPLWFMFGAAASAGVAYWWMTQWTRALNVEARPARLPYAPPSPVEIAEAAPAEAELLEAVAPAEAALAEVAADVVHAAPAPIAEEPTAAEMQTPTPAAVAEVEAAAGDAEAVADDLTRLVGVGPKLAVSLAQRGVTRFGQIAAWTESDLAEVDRALSLKGRATREAWVAQAKRLASGG